MLKDERIYLDYAATTPLSDEVKEVMRGCEDIFGNPSSLYAEGRKAKTALDEARRLVAEELGAASPREIVFTPSGSASDNLALRGLAKKAKGRKRIVCSAIEHHAVLHCCQELEKEGFALTLIPVDSQGRITTEALRSVMDEDVLFVSAMLANNEFGTIQPIAELSAIAHGVGALFHCDAVQAIGALPVQVNDLGVDLLSLTAHKIYGPKGIGVLYMRSGIEIAPLVFGGAQEMERWAGTEDVAAATAMAYALKAANEKREHEAERLEVLREQCKRGLLASVPDISISGAEEAHLPGILHVCISEVNADALLMRLDLAGIAASGGSACASGTLEASHVMHATKRDTLGAPLRLSMGRFTTQEQMDAAIIRIAEVVDSLRAKRE